MLNIKNKYLLMIGVAFLGGAIGYVYYYFIGCKSDCPIQSNPIISVLYGAALGAIITFPTRTKKR